MTQTAFLTAAPAPAHNCSWVLRRDSCFGERPRPAAAPPARAGSRPAWAGAFHSLAGERHSLAWRHHSLAGGRHSLAEANIPTPWGLRRVAARFVTAKSAEAAKDTEKIVHHQWHEWARIGARCPQARTLIPS